jgi:hypothetical protein
MRVVAVLLAFLLLAAAPGVRADDRTFIADGVPVASFSDALSGSETRDYVYPARKGQRMEISLSSKSDEVYFRLRKGGETVYDSRKGGNYLSGFKIKQNGRYTIRIYLRKVDEGHVRHYSLLMRLK